MTSVQRTPPKTSRTPTKNMPQTQFEPDINSALMCSEFVNPNRSKRRKGNSPKSVPVVSPQDLQNTLAVWKEDQERTMSKLLSDIGEIKAQNAQIQVASAEIKQSNEDIVQSISFINNEFEELKKEVEALRKERLQQRQYIENLEKKIQDLQHQSRSSGIELRNIPAVSDESSSSLAKAVCNIGKVIGLPISEGELRDVYRLPGKPSTVAATLRPVIVELTTVQKKQTLISAVRNYNKGKDKTEKINTSHIGISGASQPIYIAEQVPSYKRTLFHQARLFAETNGFKYCWISNGNIFLRKSEGERQILIHTEKCLHEANNISK